MESVVGSTITLKSTSGESVVGSSALEPDSIMESLSESGERSGPLALILSEF